MSKLSLDTTDTADTIDRVSSTDNTKVQDSFTQFPSSVTTQFSHLLAQVKACEPAAKHKSENKKRKLSHNESGGVDIVNESLEILSSFKYVPLDRVVRAKIQDQAIEILRRKNVFWPYLMDTRVVSTFDTHGNFQANHINIRSRPEFTTMLHHELGPDSMICFMASEQLSDPRDEYPRVSTSAGDQSGRGPQLGQFTHDDVEWLEKDGERWFGVGSS